MKNQLVRFDWALKKLLRNKANFDILEGFLSELLLVDVKIEQILESESNKQSADDKHNRVDLLAQINSICRHEHISMYFRAFTLPIYIDFAVFSCRSNIIYYQA